MPRFNPRDDIPAPVQPQVRPQGVNLPRLINFTGQPFQNMTLQALQQRQDDFAQQAAEPMPEIRHPLQGVAHLLNQFNAAAGQRMAADQEAADRSKIAELMTRLDPTTGEIHPSALADLSAIDPELGQKIYFDLKARQAAAAKATAEATTPKLTDLNTIYDNVTKMASYQKYSVSKPLYDEMVQAAGRKGKAAELNMVYALANLMDPGSVVREGEAYNVQRTAAWDEQFKGIMESVFNTEESKGGVMSPATRQALLAEAFSRVNTYAQAYRSDSQHWIEFAKRHGIDPRDVVPAISDVQSPPALEQPKPDETTPEEETPEETSQYEAGQTYEFEDAKTHKKEKYRFKGGDPSKAENWEPM